MQTVEIYIYKFSELSDSAKEYAINKWREYPDYHWSKDNEDTLKAFESLFPVTVTDWGYGYRNTISFKMDYQDYEEVLEFTGIRLLKYLVNNYWHDLFKGKFISNGQYVNGKYTYKKRYSKVMFDNCCVLTGYCMDYDILDPIYKFMKNPDKHTTLEDLINDCLWSWVYACNRDYEYSQSDEYITEEIEANDYDFTTDGKMH